MENKPKYIVIAGAVPSLNSRKVHSQGDIIEQDFFKPGEIADLIQRGFIEEYKETEEVKETPTKKK